jgi:hypothetical protein
MRAPRVTLCLGFSRRFFFKISDKKTKALTADEKFFQQHDTDPTLDFIESLERERALLEEKEKQAEQTEEWKEYDREVEAVIYELEHEWLTDPRPISKDSVKHARLVMEAAVKKVWLFFRRLLEYCCVSSFSGGFQLCFLFFISLLFRSKKNTNCSTTCALRLIRDTSKPLLLMADPKMALCPRCL